MEVDLGSVVANAAVLGQISSLYAVVKADAYGHGAVPVALALESGGGIVGFAVSLVEEGVELREAGIRLPILVMGPSIKGGEATLFSERLSPMVSSLSSLESILAASAIDGERMKIHLKVDTGMGRLGLTEGELDIAMARIESGPGVELAGVASHLACADDDDPDDPDCLTLRQIRRFDDLVACRNHAAMSPRSGGERSAASRPWLRHIANSAGALRFPGSRYDAVRAGLALYGSGVAAADGRFSSGTRLVSAVTQIRSIDEGSTVSYGALWRAKRPSRVAVVPVGYADGLPRSLTGVAQALIRGRRVDVVGAISMDITVLDITNLPDIVAGEEVVFLGRQQGEEITIAEFAAGAGLSEYEVTCGISKRVPRDYR